MPLYVKESGPAGAPAIVFLHGGGVSGWMWEPQVEALGDCHCLVPDLPEHGRSAGEKPFTILDSAARAADLIRARARGGRACVVGISLGGQIALQLLRTAPEVVERALISGTLVRSLPGMGLLYASANLMYKLYMPFQNQGWLIRANMQSTGIPAQYFPQVREDTRLLTAGALARVLEENGRFRIPHGLPGAAPVLVMAGQNEPGILRGSMADIVRALPGARGYRAPKVGHLWNLQAPELFNRTLRAWIEDRPLPPERLLTV
jgi:pimeloyl-ACP methyl ester carboxylesterase